MFLYGKDRKKEEHTVKILFYDTKSYDKESFEAKAKDYPDIQIEYLKSFFYLFYPIHLLVYGLILHFCFLN